MIKKKVTILGSSGQIGAYLTDYLREKGHEVLEFDKNNGEGENLTTIPMRAFIVLFNGLTLYSFLLLM